MRSEWRGKKKREEKEFKSPDLLWNRPLGEQANFLSSSVHTLLFSFLCSQPFKRLLMWTLNVYKVGFWAEAIGPAVSGWGHCYQRAILFPCWYYGQIICHIVNFHNGTFTVRRRLKRRDSKKKRKGHIWFRLLLVKAQNLACGSLLWSAK